MTISSQMVRKYNGLALSESADSGFCKYCVLFARCGPTVVQLGVRRIDIHRNVYPIFQ